jgi:hypothetical protein
MSTPNRSTSRPSDPIVVARQRGAFAGAGGRLKRKQRRRRKPQQARAPPPNAPRFAMSIKQFCESHSISEAFFHKLRAQGLGPATMKIGARVLVSVEAAAAWRKAREAAAQAENTTTAAV